MVVYHFFFDLTLFGLVDWPVPSHPAWRTFAASIASTFLFLVGVSLVYAHQNGVRWKGFLRRLAVLAACAAAVSVATILATPGPVYFGILHAIATFSVLALPFVFAPAAVTLVVAALVFVAPFFLTGPAFQDPLFYPLGLAPTRPFSMDYEPIFPWASVTLLGVAFAKLAPRPAGAPVEGPVLNALTFAGRHSLLIYMVHQPILFGALMVVVQLS